MEWLFFRQGISKQNIAWRVEGSEKAISQSA
jgi:hypothetical protein